MKKFLYFLFLTTFVIASCSKDDNDENYIENGQGSFTINGTQYNLKSGKLKYWENWNNFNFHSYTLTLTTSGIKIIDGKIIPEDNISSLIFFYFITDSGDDLPSGTYQYFYPEITSGTFDGVIDIDHNHQYNNSEVHYSIINGTVEVLNHGAGNYEFIFDCITGADFETYGPEISGSFEGDLILEGF